MDELDSVGLVEGVDFVVVWNGTMARNGLLLLPPRESRLPEGGPREPRKYTWTGNHTKEKREAKQHLVVRKAIYGVVDIAPEQGENSIIARVTQVNLGWADRQLLAAKEAADSGGEWD